MARSRAYLLISAFALLLVLFPFLFWYFTWFGRPLSDADIGAYLADTAKPRHAQHALVQIGEHMARADASVRRWYPEVVQLAASPRVELRQTSAWIMGQDHTYAPFHAALVKLLADPQPMVRRNAALALSNFHDPACRPELLAMLRPYTIVSPAAGALHYRLKLSEYVNPGTLVAHVGTVEVRSPLPGEVRDLNRPEGSTVAAGQPLVEISADKEHAWESLRALWSVGAQEDLDEIQRYTHGVPGMPEKVQEQALVTIQAIQRRGMQQPPAPQDH
ncbi:MAG TPA: HEAT repeat domain-containing protein [Bryobacteraceae bacterium]|nr:HEAT repeat domain-containing protein [Bryobacteraceae bacterium]